MRDSPVLRFVAAATLLSGSLTLAACGDAGNHDDASPPDGRIPLIVDTDMAAEGMMSVLYLLSQEDLDVRAITVSGTGLVHGEAGAAQAQGLLELASAEAIPVAYGPEQPLSGYNTFPGGWRVEADEAYGAQFPDGGETSAPNAPELIVQTIQTTDGPTVVYTDGPLTNLAAALRLEPGIAENISMVWTMGGAVDVPGNTTRNPDAEWNIWIDPTAAAEVLRSEIPVTLVPLDATNQVPLNIFHLRALEQHAVSPVARTVVAVLEGNEQLGSGGLCFWDQLTAALLTDETLASFGTATITISEGKPEEAGTTVRSEEGADVRIPTTIDTERFEQEFLSALAGAEVGPIARQADMTASYDGVTWTFEGPASVEPGLLAVDFHNDGTHEAGVAIGWVPGDTTEEEILAWSSIQQPPWLELDGAVFREPGATAGAVTVTEPGTHYVFGLMAETMTATALGQFEVTD